MGNVHEDGLNAGGLSPGRGWIREVLRAVRPAVVGWWSGNVIWTEVIYGPSIPFLFSVDM
jgi:hypothetical protein